MEVLFIMTNELKRFKLEKIDNYKQQISQEERIAAHKTFTFGLAAAGMACAFSEISNSNTNEVLRLIDLCFGLLSTGVSAYSLKRIIESISRKTMLQGKVEDINFELNMVENDESRGMKR